MRLRLRLAVAMVFLVILCLMILRRVHFALLKEFIMKSVRIE